MTIQLGYNSFLGIGVITGTTLVNTGASEFVFFNSMAFTRDQNVSQVQEMGVGGRAMKRMQFGNVTCSGQFTKYVDEYNGIGLYRYVLGGSQSSASIGSGTFTHTFYEGTDVLDGGTQVRLQFEPQIGGNSGTTRIWGVALPESYALSARSGELPTESFNFKIQDHTAQRNTITTASFTMIPPINGTKCFVKLGATITVTSITNCTDFSLNISNNILENRNLGTTTVSQFQYGVRNVTGSFNLVFEDYSMYNNFVNNTSTAIEFVMESGNVTSGTTHCIKFKMPECFYTGAHPSVNDMGQIIQPINFVANYSSNASYQVRVEVINSQSTALI